MLEEDEGSLAAAYLYMVGERCAVSAAVSKVDVGMFVDVGIIGPLLTLDWYLGF